MPLIFFSPCSLFSLSLHLSRCTSSPVKADCVCLSCCPCWKSRLRGRRARKTCSFCLTRALKSSETHAVNPKLCAPPRAVKIMTFFFHILPERVFCEGSRANLRSILDPTLWASFPWGITSAHQAKNSSKSAGLWQHVQGCSAAKWTERLVSQAGQGSTSSVPCALRSAQTT